MSWAFLFVLFAAPLAMGSYRTPFYVPLAAAAYIVGIASWARARLARAGGEPVPLVPGTRAVLLLHGVVLLQLVPLPAFLLAIVSPGSYVFYGRALGFSGWSWRPISVWPAWTANSLIYLAAISLAYATAFRDFRDGVWRRRLAITVVLAGLALALVGLVQASSAEPHKIYGIWRPRVDWAVFGPYENKTHFANYLVMAIPVAAALALQAVKSTARAWRRRSRRRWISLLDGEGPAAWRWSAATAVLVVGLLASQSRGGLASAAISMAVLVALIRRREGALLLLLALLPFAFWVVQEGKINHGEPLWSANDGRLPVRPIIWRDTLRVFPHFPLLGVGLGAFPVAYRRYQTVFMHEVVPAAHNEYLQGMLELGLLGAALMCLLIFEFARRGVTAARRDTLAAGAFCAAIASAVHCVVDFNWHIPANALTFAALAGLAVQPLKSPPDVSEVTTSREPRLAPAVSVEGLSVHPPKAARGIAS
jgi:O-antigen ligase